jgi:FixJ family two-component response regulator
LIGSFAIPWEGSLGRLGYTVEAVPSTIDFLASPRLSETACLFADVNMPAMTATNSTFTSSMQGARFPQSS